jgi:hypothetical protein
VRLRGLAEVRAEKVAPVLVRRGSRQAVSAATRCSLLNRGPPTVIGCHASRSLVRPFRAHRRATPVSPPDCTLMSFPPLQRMRSRGFGSLAPCDARARPCDLGAGVPHLPPSGLSVSHALAGFHPATPFRACFIPVTLLGFRLQGLDPPGEPHLSRGPLLSCRSTRARGRSATRTDRGFRALIPPESPDPAKDRNPIAADALLAFSLPRRSRSPARRRTGVPRAFFRHSRARVLRILPRTSPAELAPDTAVPRSVGPPEFSASPLARRRPSWGSSPRPDRILANPSGCR